MSTGSSQSPSPYVKKGSSKQSSVAVDPSSGRSASCLSGNLNVFITYHTSHSPATPASGVKSSSSTSSPPAARFDRLSLGPDTTGTAGGDNRYRSTQSKTSGQSQGIAAQSNDPNRPSKRSKAGSSTANEPATASR